MVSNSLLSSRYYDKLKVNRLETQTIVSDNILPEKSSYLFSINLNNAKFDRNENGGNLLITKNDTESIIQFSDRPLRQTETIDFEFFIDLFKNNLENNSFSEDPPNGVLIHDEEQRTYIIRLSKSDNDSAIFNLELLPGEKHNLSTITGKFNLFVDSSVGLSCRLVSIEKDISENDSTLSYQNKSLNNIMITLNTLGPNLKLQINRSYNISLDLSTDFPNKINNIKNSDMGLITDNTSTNNKINEIHTSSTWEYTYIFIIKTDKNTITYTLKFINSLKFINL